MGLLGVLTLASPANARTESTDCKTVTSNITDRPDSAPGDYNWANDTFKRTVKLCTDPSVASITKTELWQYTAVGDDEGTFKTLGVKSFAGATMKTGVTGTFSGHFEEHFTAPAGWVGFSDATVKDSNKYSTSEWIGHLWGEGYNVRDFSWGWTYKLCNEELTNAAKGNHGDITGLSVKTLKACIVVTFKDTCTGTDVTVKNNAPNEKAYAWIKINDSKPFPIAGNGTTKTMNVPGTDTNIKVYLYTGGYSVEKDVVAENHQNSKWSEIGSHKWVKTDCATPAATPTPSHSAAVPIVGSLPVTGVKVPVIIGTGVLFAIGGVVLLVWSRKRKTKFVTE